jgi:hemolysin D
MRVLSVRGAATLSDAAGLRLLEFQSPADALAQEPVQGRCRGTVWVVCSLVAACAAAMALIPVDKVVIAGGKVVSLAPTVVVQPLETGIIRSIEVQEGQVVRGGDLLARLDPTFTTADVAALRAQVASLDAEVARLRAEATGQPYHAQDAGPVAMLQSAIFMQRQAERGFKMENYRQRISALDAQLQRSQADEAGYRDRLGTAEELEDRRKQAERLHVGSVLNRLSATDARMEISRSLNGAVAQVEQTTRELQALVAERDAYDQQWRAQVSQQLSESERKLAEQREQLAKAQLRRQLVELRADQDAVVLTVARVSVGSVLQSGDQFVTLVPLDAPLEAEVNVPGDEAGFVHAGNAVTVKFDTFPFVRYGTAEGRVRFVSADSFAPSTNPDTAMRGTRQPQPPTPQAFYRGRVTLDAVKLHDVPLNFRVVPGMPITADIKVGKRTIMTYLLGRVLPVAMDGMREP